MKENKTIHYICCLGYHSNKMDNKKVNRYIWLLILVSILLSFILLILRPVTMFPDGIARYLPNAKQLLQGDISFYSNPLFISFEAFWILLFKGNALLFAWKLTSFIFFVITAILLTEFMNKTNMGKIERLIFCSMFLFSTWTLLLSTAVLQDMLLACLTLAAFLCIENYFDKAEPLWAIAVIISIAAMLYTKASGYIILLGFFLYVIAKKIKWNMKIRCIVLLITGLIIGLPWAIKNQILTGHSFLGTSEEAQIVVESGKLFQFGTIDYWQKFVETFHYFWEIPLPSKTGFAANPLFNLYHITALVVMGLFSIIFILSVIKYLKKHSDYLLLIGPLFAFSVIYWPFITYFDSSDAGRYSFPFFVFMFLFISRFIAGLKNRRIRIIAYLLVVAFCLLSIASAFGITLHMRNLDSQILKMVEVIPHDANVRANDMFTSTALSFYLNKKLIFGQEGNVIDTAVSCNGEPVFYSKNFDVAKQDSKYSVCRR